MDSQTRLPDSSLAYAGYVVERPDMQTLQTIRRDLTARPLDGSGVGGPPRTFKLFDMTGSTCVVPRYWGLEHLGPARDTRPAPHPVKFDFNGTLRTNLSQPAAVEAVRASCTSCGGAVLSLPPGHGKTTVALYLAATLGVKTMVVTHSTVLKDQWRQRILQFLPGARVSEIQGSACDTSGDITLAMLQTLVSRRGEHDFTGYGLLIVDECFPYKQMIMTENGPMTIGRIYKYWKQGTRIRVTSFNEKTQAFELRDVTYAWEKQATELVKVSYSKSSYRATSNHPVLTTGGWKATGDVVPGDLLISRYNLDEQAVALAMNSDQYQVFLGSLLGDGHLHNLPSQRYRLKVTHGPKQREYIEWKAGIFGAKTYLNDTEYAFSTRVIDLPSHKTFRSKTHCPQWVLDELDERGLAIWIMDDANLTPNGGMRITNTFDEDSQRRMCLKLGSMGIDATYRPNKRDGRSYFYISMSSGRTAARLIAPYIHPSMAYKVVNPRALISAETVGTHVWNRAFLDYGTLRVGSTEKYVPSDPRVYDLEVQGTHTFVCASIRGNGPVVHNCHHVAAEGFSTAMRGLSFKYTLGLSATLDRRDGLGRVINQFLGPTAYHVSQTGMRHVQIQILKYDCPAYKQPPPMTRAGTVCFSSLMTRLVDDMTRTARIAEATVDLARTRDVLVLSHRRGHCQDLAREITRLGVPAETYLGGDTVAPTARVVVATYALVGEGFDDPRFSGLVLATPGSNPVQAVGRILRGGSDSPRVIDVIDAMSIFYAQAAKRRGHYKRAGFSGLDPPKRPVVNLFDYKSV